MVAELNDEKLKHLAEIAQDVRAVALRAMPRWRREIWNAAIDAAALLVEPVPHIDEERTCAEVAAEIRKLRMMDTPGVSAPANQPIPEHSPMSGGTTGGGEKT